MQEKLKIEEKITFLDKNNKQLSFRLNQGNKPNSISMFFDSPKYSQMYPPVRKNEERILKIN